jgi:hypothetical protein
MRKISAIGGEGTKKKRIFAFFLWKSGLSGHFSTATGLRPILATLQEERAKAGQ